MSEEETLPPQVKYWLSPEAKYDCYFIVGPESGPKERIGSFKAFLIGYSEPFRAMVRGTEIEEQKDVAIVDIQPGTFRHFLTCLYMNCVNITKEGMSFQVCVDLLYVADKYLVTHVYEKLVTHLLSILNESIGLEDVFIALDSQHFLGEFRLEKKFRIIFVSKIKKIFASPSFLNISSESLLWILTLDNVGTEIEIWHEILKWAIHQTGSNDGKIVRQHMLKHLKFIQFHAMSLADFCQHVVPTDVLTHAEVYEICKSVGLCTPPNINTFNCNIRYCRKNKNPTETTFSFCVNDVSNMKEKVCSQYFKFQGIDWFISAKRVRSISPTNVEQYLQVNLNSKSMSQYECSVVCTLTLVKHNGEGLTHYFTHEYCNEDPSEGIHEFCIWSEMVKPTNKYVVNNCITILAHIEVGQ